MTFTKNKYNAIKQTYKGEVFCFYRKLEKANKKNKFNAKKQIYKGLKFDSKKELKRFVELDHLLRAREISNLEIHPRFDLMVNGVKIGRYTADFRYNKGNEVVVEDVKSKATKTRDYMLRKKILATYDPPITITEIL
jgi:hypothetical protein